MNRRGFLGRFGQTGAAIAGLSVLSGPRAITEPYTQADPTTYCGYRIVWRDWMNMNCNQAVVFGMWLAKHETQDNEYVSTSHGQCYPSRAWEVVDMTVAKGWPILTAFTTDAEKEAAKQRALVALRSTLDRVSSTGAGGVM